VYNTKLTDLVANAQADAQAPLANGGYMRWYDGTQPATGGAAITTQNKVAELRFGTPAFGAAASGIIAANAITPDPAAIGGTVSWFRIFQADGTSSLWDGSIGVKDSPNAGDHYDIELNSVIIPAGVECGLTAFTHTVAK